MRCTLVVALEPLIVPRRQQNLVPLIFPQNTILCFVTITYYERNLSARSLKKAAKTFPTTLKRVSDPAMEAFLSFLIKWTQNLLVVLLLFYPGEELQHKGIGSKGYTRNSILTGH